MCCMFGQCLGSSTTGIALGRCVDPDAKTSAYDSFGIAASIFAPMSAVLVAVMPLVTLSSDWMVIGIALVIAVVNIVIGEFVLRKVS